MGWFDIIDFIEPEKAYELVDEAVKLIFRQNFNEGKIRGSEVVIINTGVFIYSYLVDTK